MTYFKSDYNDGAWCIWAIVDDALLLYKAFDPNNEAVWQDNISIESLSAWGHYDANDANDVNNDNEDDEYEPANYHVLTRSEVEEFMFAEMI